MQARLTTLEAKVRIIKFNCEANQKTADRVIAEVKEIVDVEYTHIIPINGGFLGLREESG